MVIQHNLSAMNSNRQLGITTGQQAKSSEKLASGYKINRAADDAAGLAISEKMRRQIRGLTQAEDNVQDGISYVQVADGALAEIDEILARMTELCVKAATETLTDKDREYIDAEIQKLKLESSRTFQTTTFNEKLIWDESTTDRKPVGTETRPLYTWGSTSGQGNTVTEVNKGAWPIPTEGFQFELSSDDQKVRLAWTGYDGIRYQSDYVDIPDVETLKSEGFSLPINASTMGNYEQYPSAVGISPAISMTLDSEATREQFINSLRNKSLSCNMSYGINSTVKMAADYTPSPNVSISVSGNVNYLTGLVSGKTVSNMSDNNHIKTDPGDGVNRDGDGIFNFVLTKDEDTLPAGGTFKAKAQYYATKSAVDVWSDDRTEATRGVWWDYPENRTYKSGIYYEYGTSTIATSIQNIVDETGANNILNNPGTGHIRVEFDIRPIDSVKYSYENADGTRTNGSTLTNLGSLNLNIEVRPGATAEDITNAVNKIEGISIGTTGGVKMGISYSVSNYSAPVYGGTMKLEIQAGADGTEDDRIPIIYDVLNNHSLKINDLNTLTVEQAQTGITKVKDAAKVVDAQRALFGSYQNRLEHTYKNLGNVVENTQNAESLIRDTDMAKEMVKYSNNNILAQAGQSMLAQANQTNQGVLSLLQ